MRILILVILFLIFMVTNTFGQYRSDAARIIINYGLDSIDLNGTSIKYCYDCDSVNPMIFFVSGYSIKTDSSIIDSTLVLNLRRGNDKFKKRHSEVYLFVEKQFKNSSTGKMYNSCCLNQFIEGDTVKIPQIPFDSTIRIENSDSTSFTCLIVPYENFFHKEITFSYPFYKEGAPLIIKNSKKGDIKSAIDMKERKIKSDKQNIINDCLYLYKHMRTRKYLKLKLKQLDSLRKVYNIK